MPTALDHFALGSARERTACAWFFHWFRSVTIWVEKNPESAENTLEGPCIVIKTPSARVAERFGKDGEVGWGDCERVWWQCWSPLVPEFCCDEEEYERS